MPFQDSPLHNNVNHMTGGVVSKPKGCYGFAHTWRGLANTPLRYAQMTISNAPYSLPISTTGHVTASNISPPSAKVTWCGRSQLISSITETPSHTKRLLVPLEPVICDYAHIAASATPEFSTALTLAVQGHSVILPLANAESAPQTNTSTSTSARNALPRSRSDSKGTPMVG